MKRIVVFASGTKTGGGSGFRKLALDSQTGKLHARVVAVVSQYPAGGVFRTAREANVPFVHFPAPGAAADYARIMEEYAPDLVVLSGWTRLLIGVPPGAAINIHPGPLPEFGGRGMYGLAVHRAVLAAYKQGIIRSSAINIHFVNDEYDRGPIIFSRPVPIVPDDTPESLQERIKRYERRFYTPLINLVLKGAIVWNGGVDRPDGR